MVRPLNGAPADLGSANAITDAQEAKMAKYGKGAQKSVESAMRRRKRGTLKSGSGGTVKSRKQAIAIGLSEARDKGAKVPPRRSRKTSSRRGSKRSSSRM